MAAQYDEQGNYIYPEGFDPETNEWLEGFETQREAWEKQYAEAHDALRGAPEAGRRRLTKADAEAAAEGGDRPPSYSSDAAGRDQRGTLASDEALAALREKLAGR